MQSPKSISRDVFCSTAAVAAIRGSRHRNRQSSCATRSWTSDPIRLDGASSLAALLRWESWCGFAEASHRDLQLPMAGCPPGSLGPQRPSEEPMKFLGYRVGRNCLQARAGSISPRARARRASATRSASLRKRSTDRWATAQSWTALAERRSARRTTLAWVRSIRTTRLTMCVQGSGCASRCAAGRGTVYAVPALRGRAPEWHASGLALPICSSGPSVRSGPF